MFKNVKSIYKAQSKLLKALSKELSHEKDNYEELKESKVSNFLLGYI